MEKNNYYDGTKLLSLMDINGNKPEIYICTSNRSAGKTTWFSRYCVKRFRENEEKFCLIYRFNYELEDCADKFFKDISELFFNGSSMVGKRKAKGLYYELYLDEKHCGYAIALNNADQYKKLSHLFSDVVRMLFDEFQSETNHYCGDEIKKFISIHTSIARGQGKFVRYLPVYMVANPISLINPYYLEMGISSRLKEDTKFLKGDGFVLEQGFNENASNSQKYSAFNRAFVKNNYVAYSSQAIYLNDNKTFIEKPKGVGRYIATIKYGKIEYGLRIYRDEGFIYCDDRPDTSYKYKITVTTDDMNINYVMLKQNDLFISMLRDYFEHGSFRFKDLKCKEALLKTLNY